VKIWAKVLKHHKIVQEAVREFPARPFDAEGWGRLITELVKPLDLASPVLLNKHVEELARFNRTWFTQADFIESIAFDRFELEIFPEKKKDRVVEYHFGDDESES
jgi:hypothetical protein